MALCNGRLFTSLFRLDSVSNKQINAKRTGKMKGKRSERARKVGDLVSCYDERTINGCLNAKGSMFITFVIHLFVESEAIQNVFSLEKFVSLFKYNVFFCGMKMLVQTEMVLKNENRIQKTPNE